MKKIYFILLIVFLNTNLNAAVKIDITRGNLEPLPAAVSDFYIDNPEKFSEGIKKLNLESNLPKVIKNNLKRSGLFYILDKKSHWNNAEIGAHINFFREPNIMEPDLHTSLSFFHL